MDIEIIIAELEDAKDSIQFVCNKDMKTGLADDDLLDAIDKIDEVLEELRKEKQL